MKKYLSLSRAVLASSFFFLPAAHADTIVAGPNNPPPPLETSTTGNIQITPAGSLTINNDDAIVVDAAATITLDPNNANNAAIDTTGGGKNAFNVDTGGNATISIGQNTKVLADQDAVFLAAPQVTINNAGTLSAKVHAINVDTAAAKTTVNNQVNGTLQNEVGGIESTVLSKAPNFILNNQGTITAAFEAPIVIETGSTSAIINNEGTISQIGPNLADFNRAIRINEISATVNNKGTIEGTLQGIQLLAPATKAIITNSAGGVITGSNGSAAIEISASGATITNSGTLSSDTDAGIRINSNFNLITNNTGGVIESQAGAAGGSAINIAAAVSGNTINSGTITTNGKVGSAAIMVSSVLNGSITNNADGIIETTAGAAADASYAVVLNDSFFNLNNAGIIRANNANDSAILIGNAPNMKGTITNTGTIEAARGGVFIKGNLTQLNNQGKITGQAAPAIWVMADNVEIADGIINSGDITRVNGVAIDLTNKNNVDVAFTQNGGTITGDVLLASKGVDNLFTINAGIIDGAVFSAEKAASKLYLKGGQINDAVVAGDMGDTIFLSGTITDKLVGGLGNDTFNISGGAVFDEIDGKAGNNTINIEGNFSLDGKVQNIQTLNVKAGTFTAKGEIAGDPAYTIDKGATFVANNPNITGNTLVNAGNFIVSDAATFSGLITNNGAMRVDNDITLTTKAFTNTGSYAVQIENAAHYSKMTVTQAGGNAVQLQGGSTINVQLVGQGAYIPLGSKFDVITAANSTVVDNSTLVQPESAILIFGKEVVNNNILRLSVTQRRPYTAFAYSDAAEGVATTLDALQSQGTTNPDFIDLFGQLDFLGNTAAIQEALESLAPPQNYALANASRVSMNSAFNTVHQRLEKMRHLSAWGQETYQVYREGESARRGYSYGDEPYSTDIGAWVKGYGVILDQRRRHQMEGYLGNAVGVALGGDWGNIDGNVVLGAALSHSMAHIVGKNRQKNVQDVGSYQATLYGWFNPIESIYVDTLVGFSLNRYKTRRNIEVGDIQPSAFATFHGFQYGAEIEAGLPVAYSGLTVAPIARVKASRLMVGSYTETGANSYNLSVKNEGLNELITGAGVRIIGKRDYAQALYATEFSAMILYDFYADREKTVANFLGGGPAFPTRGIKPGQTFGLFDLGMNAYTHDNYTFSVKYELELRDHYFGHAGYIQLRYDF